MRKLVFRSKYLNHFISVVILFLASNLVAQGAIANSCQGKRIKADGTKSTIVFQKMTLKGKKSAVYTPYLENRNGRSRLFRKDLFLSDCNDFNLQVVGTDVLFKMRKPFEGNTFSFYVFRVNLIDSTVISIFGGPANDPATENWARYFLISAKSGDLFMNFITYGSEGGVRTASQKFLYHNWKTKESTVIDVDIPKRLDTEESVVDGAIGFFVRNKSSWLFYNKNSNTIKPLTPMPDGSYGSVVVGDNQIFYTNNNAGGGLDLYTAGILDHAIETPKLIATEIRQHRSCELVVGSWFQFLCINGANYFPAVVDCGDRSIRYRRFFAGLGDALYKYDLQTGVENEVKPATYPNIEISGMRESCK